MPAARIKTSAIQNPSPDNTVTVQRQMKENIEVAQRLRGDPNDSFVRVSELTQGGLFKLVNDALVPGTVSSGDSGLITVANSITGAGTSASPLQLQGDSASPGNSMLYGTNGSGVKGWYSQTGGSSSPLTTKGDIYVYSTANTRLPVGTNGQVLKADSTQTTGLAWGSADNVTPDTHPSAPTAYDDEFEGAAISAAWTAHLASGVYTLAQGSAVQTNNTGSILFIQAMPSAPWEFTIRTINPIGVANSSCWALLALNSSSGNAVGSFLFTGDGNAYIQRGTFNTTTWVYTFVSNPVNGLATYLSKYQWLYIKMALDAGGTTLTFSVSVSGLPGTFLQLGTETVATFLSSITHVGCAASVGGTSISGGAIDWFRRTA